MADILIQMNMPNSCVECSFAGLSVSVSILGASCPWCREIIDTKVDLNMARHENCPLQELPEHGNLIDASKLIPIYEEMKWSDDYCKECMKGAIWEVEQSPVIIPASKEESE